MPFPKDDFAAFLAYVPQVNSLLAKTTDPDPNTVMEAGMALVEIIPKVMEIGSRLLAFSDVLAKGECEVSDEERDYMDGFLKVIKALASDIQEAKVGLQKRGYFGAP